MGSSLSDHWRRYCNPFVVSLLCDIDFGRHVLESTSRGLPDSRQSSSPCTDSGLPRSHRPRLLPISRLACETSGCRSVAGVSIPRELSLVYSGKVATQSSNAGEEIISPATARFFALAEGNLHHRFLCFRLHPLDCYLSRQRVETSVTNCVYP